MKDFSDALSILIPMYNEERMIGTTLEELVRTGFHKRYKIVICDDDSTDKSIAEAQRIAQVHDSISLVKNKPNGNKIGAVKTGLRHIKTPYVLLLDADSMVLELTEGYLDVLVEKMKDQGIAVMGFKVRARATNLLEYLQALEYLLSTDGLRRLLGVVVCLSGLGTLWEVDSLKIVLARHSGIFEGDDLESTILATSLDFKVAYEARGAVVTTGLKRNLGELFTQRMHIWDVGLIRAFVSTHGFLKQKGRDGAFFKGVLITEVLAHPFKIVSITGLFLTSFLVLMESLSTMPDWRLLSQINDFTVSILQSTGWMYFLLWLLNMASIIRAIRSCPRPVLSGLLFVLYFTFYMATPLIPLISTDFGQVLGFTYLWWYGLCALLILLGSESWETKWRSLILNLLLPLYFAFLLAFPRTLGFAKYVLGRVRGQYTSQSSIVCSQPSASQAMRD